MVNINGTQNAFLVEYLRGTKRTLTAKQAQAWFGIQNFHARLSELRDLGLVVRCEKLSDTRRSNGRRNKYSISSRDVFGSRRSFIA